MKAAPRTQQLLLSTSQLLALVDSGTLALPDFQREFQWSSSDVKAFLATILAGLPAGTLIVVSDEPGEMVLRPLTAAPRLAPEGKVRLLLDGQQRVTSLYHAVRQVGQDRYFVNFSALTEGADLLDEDVIIRTSPRRDLDEARLFSGSDAILVPFAALYSSETFFEWLARQGMDYESESAVGDAFATKLVPYEHYAFPVLELSGSGGWPVYAQIFERLNKAGLQLDSFDILVARVRSGSWSLRHAWDELLDEKPLVRYTIGENPLSVLTALSLVERNDVRRSALLELDGSVLRSGWSSLGRATVDAAEFLESVGVRAPSLVPYAAQISFLVAWFLRSDNADSQLLRRFFWSTCLSERYDGAVNTRLIADWRNPERTIATAGELLESGLAARLSSNTRRSSRALWATIQCAMIVHGARDLVTGDLLGSHIGPTSDYKLRPIFRGRTDQLDDQLDVPPLRSRTLGTVMAGSLTTKRLEVDGFRGLVARHYNQTELFGASVDERLSSQFLPPAEGLVRREIDGLMVVKYRATELENYFHLLLVGDIEAARSRGFLP